MDLYMSVLFNMGTNSRGSRGALVFGRKDTNTVASSSTMRFDIDDETDVRRVIQLISIGDFAHLPHISSLKALFKSTKHQALLRRTYKELHMKHLSIDDTAARVLSLILLSPQCCCRHVRIHRCAFTATGHNIFFSALSVMAEPPSSSKLLLLPPPTKTSFSMNCIKGKGNVADEGGTAIAYCLHNVEDAAKAAAAASPASAAIATTLEEGDQLPMGLFSFDYTQIGMSDSKCSGLSDVLLLQPYLHTLDISNNVIGSSGLARLIGSIASGCPSLRELNLSGNQLRSEGSRILARYLANKGRFLESLDISSNEISHTGALAIVGSLDPRVGCRLKRLNLDMNQFEAAGCEALGRILAENKHLDTLILSRNNIFDNGCYLLFEGLKYNKTLRHLDISGNFLTHLSARDISNYLILKNTNRKSSTNSNDSQEDSMHQGLCTLNISTNALRDEGIETLCVGLKDNSHLVHLIANNVDVADAGMGSIKQLLETTAARKRSLLTLSLRHNRHATRAGYEALGSGCLQNRWILRVIVDMHFDGWSTVWDKVERAFIRNTMRAVDRYRVPLQMVACGRPLLVLCDRQSSFNTSPSSIQRLPAEIRRLVLLYLDRYQVLTPEQKRGALRIASDISCQYPSKMSLLAEILGTDYHFVAETMKTLRSA
ncbi:NACHT, LRR and PYD domains-containing protein 14 [Coemansia umbellata]|nr:NACHT, LRR and PYD domains-containing protein 14 [Coemansia umbellata]